MRKQTIFVVIGALRVKTFALLNLDISSLENSVDHDQLASAPFVIQGVCHSIQLTLLENRSVCAILIYYGKCSKISNTLKLRTPKIITKIFF